MNTNEYTALTEARERVKTQFYIPSDREIYFKSNEQNSIPKTSDSKGMFLLMAGHLDDSKNFDTETWKGIYDTYEEALKQILVAKEYKAIYSMGSKDPITYIEGKVSYRIKERSYDYVKIIDLNGWKEDFKGK